jgi:protein SCO1/2
MTHALRITESLTKHLFRKKKAPLILCAIFLAVTQIGCQKTPLPDLGKVQAFSLISEKGTPFSSEQLKEKIWVASFFFSRCKTICPKLLGSLQDLHEQAADRGIPLEIVTITVDPEHDTPEVLQTKAKEYRTQKTPWHFLTGSPDTIRDVIVNGFKTHMGEKEILENGILEIGHGSKLILLDGQGIVRGFYSANKEEQEELLTDAEKLKP